MAILKTGSSFCLNQFVARSTLFGTANNFLLRKPTRWFSWVELNDLYIVTVSPGPSRGHWQVIMESRLIKSDLLMIKRFQLLLQTTL